MRPLVASAALFWLCMAIMIGDVKAVVKIDISKVIKSIPPSSTTTETIMTTTVPSAINNSTTKAVETSSAVTPPPPQVTTTTTTAITSTLPPENVANETGNVSLSMPSLNKFPHVATNREHIPDGYYCSCDLLVCETEFKFFIYY